MKANLYEKYLKPELFYTLDEISKLYGPTYKRNFTNSLILKDEELFNTWKQDDLIEVNILNNKKKISKKLIHELLRNEGMYRYLISNLNNELGIAARIDYIENKTTIKSIKITKAELGQAISLMSSEFSFDEQLHLACVNNTIQYPSCEKYFTAINNTSNLDEKHLEIAKYKCEIDGMVVSVLKKDFLEFLKLPEEEFNKVIISRNYKGIQIEYFLYSLVDFVEKERLFDKFYIPENIQKRYMDIISFSIIDFESLNKNRIKNDLYDGETSIIDMIEISSELRDALDAEMNKTYSNLEKIIYYYIKLCEILTFKQDNYINQREEVDENEIFTISSITPENNEVITYDFILIFTKLLSELNIQYTLDQTILAGINNRNSKVTFRYGEYLLSLNSLDNINRSDLINSKVNDTLINLTCINRQEITKRKFTELVEKIYNDIIEKKESKIRFENAIATYKEKYEQSNCSTEKRIYLLLKAISNTNLKGLNSISYEKKVFNCLFKKNPNININFVCRADKDEDYITPITIISVLENEDYSYFVVDANSPEKIEHLNQLELLDLFETKTLYYLDNNKVPGIEDTVGEIYVR